MNGGQDRDETGPESSGGRADGDPAEPDRLGDESSIDGDRWVQIHQEQYDREHDGELATTLAMAIAAAKDVDPVNNEAMPPLYEAIDAQALEDTFFGPSSANTERKEEGSVNFAYAGCMVTLRANGWIGVYEPR